MRIALLLATSALVAACSTTTDGTAAREQSLAIPPLTSGSIPGTPSTPAARSSAPAAGTAIADVIRWVEAGRPVDTAAFRSATRDGTTTDLGQDVAFVSGDANCMTDHRFGGALACLVDLADPPPQPTEVYGQWKGNWVDFEGPTAEVGSVHGDPGRFGSGTGAELAAGQTLAFGDYRCRDDAAGVYCVNYAHGSALKLSGDGIEVFGCLQQVTPPADVGVKYGC